jgi:hypothetical protein
VFVAAQYLMWFLCSMNWRYLSLFAESTAMQLHWQTSYLNSFQDYEEHLKVFPSFSLYSIFDIDCTRVSCQQTINIYSLIFSFRRNTQWYQLGPRFRLLRMQTCPFRSTSSIFRLRRQSRRNRIIICTLSDGNTRNESFGMEVSGMVSLSKVISCCVLSPVEGDDGTNAGCCQ